ncbi:glycosyltransferase [Belliella kenyensis]|uniref:Glycosyltransferase n=1 Tax=Belliella kenyensis TaxID=1472724 RepID=A0ABV8EFC2_9BACT|nr:glycosyltransferase [Belliella kenyensis]MCH7401714.1 glycosyltransferase [Belliella kenyensis]MDN3604214.1 glycosyltransferase [Belliella kenyensis]
MKIGLIAHYGEDYYKSRHDFVSYLEEKGNKCFAFVPEDDYKVKIDKLTSDVFYYKYSRNWKFVFSLISVFKLFTRKFKEEQPEIVFTYKFFPNLVGILAAKSAQVPNIIATIAGIGFLENYRKNPFIWFVFKLYMIVLDKANIVIAQNKEDLNLLKKNLQKAKVIMTHGSGVNAVNFVNKNDFLDDFLMKNNLSKEKKYIGFCSRIVKEKGIIELVKAFNSVDSSYDLLIAGWFDETKIEVAVLNLIKGNPKIHYLGYQENVSEFLEVTEFIVLPSYYPEGVPRSLIEALSLSKAIITTDHKGCKETCIDNLNGFLVRPKSIEDLKNTFLKIEELSDVKLNSFKENSLKLFLEKFDREIVYKTIWESILSYRKF